MALTWLATPSFIAALATSRWWSAQAATCGKCVTAKTWRCWPSFFIKRPTVSATAPPTPDDDRRIVLSQDANIFVSEYDRDHPQTFAVRPGRQAYLVCIEGALSLNGTVNLGARDAAEVTGPVDITFTTPDKAHFLLVEMAA